MTRNAGCTLCCQRVINEVAGNRFFVSLWNFRSSSHTYALHAHPLVVQRVTLKHAGYAHATNLKDTVDNVRIYNNNMIHNNSYKKKNRRYKHGECHLTWYHRLAVQLVVYWNRNVTPNRVYPLSNWRFIFEPPRCIPNDWIVFIFHNKRLPMANNNRQSYRLCTRLSPDDVFEWHHRVKIFLNKKFNEILQRESNEN